MGDEQDSWFKKTFGVDPGEAFQEIQKTGSAVVQEVKSLGGHVVQGVQQAVSAVAEGAAGAAKKIGGGGAPASKPAAPAASSAPVGSFPLSGSVGQGGQNAASDVKAVQKALGIAADGLCGPQTIAAIVAFQKKMGQASPDGRVDKGGGTERALSGGAQPAAAPPPAAPQAPPSGGNDSGSLFDRAVQGAKDLAGGLEDLGGKVVKGVQEVLDDPNLLLNQLKSPSYVNNPNTPPALQGGGTASGGDSYFVTGGQKGQLVARIKGIYDAATAIDNVAKTLEQKGKSGFFNDDQLIQSAKNLQGAASALFKLAKQLDNWTGDSNKGSIEKGSKAVEYVDKIIKAAETVAAVNKLRLATENLEKKTSEQTVDAWADSVGETFDKAANILDFIPSGALPGFVVDYYKGLFSAPKNYIAAFKTMLKVHYGTIDKEGGVSGGKRNATDLGKTGLDWKGDLSGLFVHAHFQPKSMDGEVMQRYILRRRTSEGVDLHDVTLQVGKAVLTAAISRDLKDEDPAKDAWINFVGKYRE